MTHAPGLETLFTPRSVAVIGASETPGAVGRALMENLASFSGRVFPINPRHKTLFGKTAYPSVSALPEVPDVALVATPAATVPSIIAQCVKAGVKAAIIISAGFKETGDAGRALEREIVETTRGSGMRILGPNCLGLMLPHLGLNASFAATMAKPGTVAFLSQSGALCTAILDWSLREEVGFSAFVSLGSMLDIGWGDLIDLLGDDPHTKSIVCYMESSGDARAFLSAAREVSFTKPIILLKVGRTAAAARAAASHTGSLTGSDAVLDAAFERAGILRVDTIEELFDLAQVLAKQSRPAGPHLAVVTNAGGPAALATDRLIMSGGRLAELDSKTIEALDGQLPAAWSHSNPIDVLGAADAVTYARSVQLAIDDENTDGVLVILTPQAMTDVEGTAAGLAALSKTSHKPILASWMGGQSLDSGRAVLNGAGIPTYDYPDAAARAFALMWHHSDHLRLLYERPALRQPAGNPQVNHSVAERVIAGARKAGRTLLTEVESKQVLSAYGIPTVETLIATDEDEAVRHASSIGYPVVLKLFSETITHKTDVGGVKLGLANAKSVREAWQAIRESVEARAGDGHFLGVTVQPMIPRQGVELILGSSVDPQFGPVLLFGAGGELVEVMKDRALGLPPLTTTLAHRLMEKTKIFHALTGVRGQKPVDLESLAELIVCFSKLVAEQRWITEVDINPLQASAGRLCALDARVVLHPPETHEDQLPRLAIRPYPDQYITHTQLKDGARLTLRPIRPEDEGMMIGFHSALSPRSVHFRYFGTLSLQARTAHPRLSRICFCDFDREIAIVAEHGRGATREVIAVGRLNRLRRRNEAEFALVVADTWQKRGVGKRLLNALIEIGRAEGFSRITGMILRENVGMVRLCQRQGFHLRNDPEAEAFLAEFIL